MTTTPQIRFDDGAAYERMMGAWSRIAGATFLDWVAPREGLRWIDVGCGNGAFTELIVERCKPASILGVDPSEGQLTFARTRPSARLATFQLGDAMALPAADASVDAAVMALVIFFVPEPPKGVAEMARVLSPGGLACAYAWDYLGGGFPMDAMLVEMRAMGLTPLRPPSAEAAHLDALRSLWTNAGFIDIETREINATRTFTDFEDYWTVCTLGTHFKSAIASLQPADIDRLKANVRARLPAPDAAGRITISARANAVKGTKPA